MKNIDASTLSCLFGAYIGFIKGRRISSLFDAGGCVAMWNECRALAVWTSTHLLPVPVHEINYDHYLMKMDANAAICFWIVSLLAPVSRRLWEDVLQKMKAAGVNGVEI